MREDMKKQFSGGMSAVCCFSFPFVGQFLGKLSLENDQTVIKSLGVHVSSRQWICSIIGLVTT